MTDDERFEAAADAVVDGDLATLERLLREHPELVNARSRKHARPALLHYVAANGVEDARQRTPPNIVEVTKLLLQAGAEVDVESHAYSGRGTTLGLTASSVHPARAGVQIALMDALLDAGAAIDGLEGGWTPLMAALANGRLAAADMLGARGARIDHIVPAAALGRLDLVASFLDKGVDVGVVDAQAMTPLHWAAARGHHDLVDLLLARGAPLEVKNVFGGTVLDSTLWFAYNAREEGPPPGTENVDFPRALQRLLDAGARSDVYPKMQQHIDEVLGWKRT